MGYTKFLSYKVSQSPQNVNRYESLMGGYGMQPFPNLCVQRTFLKTISQGWYSTENTWERLMHITYRLTSY